MSNRLEWSITKTSRWIATHNVTGEILTASTKELLMSKINEWDRA